MLLVASPIKKNKSNVIALCPLSRGSDFERCPTLTLVGNNGDLLPAASLERHFSLTLHTETLKMNMDMDLVKNMRCNVPHRK
jgi:hypothetical protein